MRNTLFLLILCCMTVAQDDVSAQTKPLTFLALGDSYTIGEAVSDTARFPMQTVNLLHAQHITFTTPHYIAKTGWTTDELQLAITAENVSTTYDAVTLLIGVNNQYRGLSKEVYRKEFALLLKQAIQFAGNNTQHVFVLSIPDWSVTPFAERKNKTRIREEVHAFNLINKDEATKAGVHYVDITPVSQLAENDESLTAYDGLHPSSKMYALWASLLAKEMEKVYQTK